MCLYFNRLLKYLNINIERLEWFTGTIQIQGGVFCHGRRFLKIDFMQCPTKMNVLLLWEKKSWIEEFCLLVWQLLKNSPTTKWRKQGEGEPVRSPSNETALGGLWAEVVPVWQKGSAKPAKKDCWLKWFQKRKKFLPFNIIFYGFLVIIDLHNK